MVVFVAVQLSVCGVYLPPVLKHPSRPPQRSFAPSILRCDRLAGRCAGGAGSHPTVGGGIASASGLYKLVTTSTPDDHFAASPHCGVKVSRGGCVGRVRGCPTSGGRGVPAASVEKRRRRIVEPSPHNHFAASPHCCVKASRVRRIKSTSASPSILGAVQRSDFRQLVASVVQVRRDTNAVLSRGSRFGCRQAYRCRRYTCRYTQTSGQPLRQDRPCQTLGDDKGIIP